MKYPRIVHAKQQFESNCLSDIAGNIKSEIDKVFPYTKIKKGDKVALTVGSRGISNLKDIVFAVVNALKEKGCDVIIIPSMGSHGGATREGQIDVLRHYGITEESMGVHIDGNMDVEMIGHTEEGLNVYVAKSALQADHIVVFNRVKAHTDFKGSIESGLCKMMTIGLGKKEGASYYHRAAVNNGGYKVIESVGKAVLKLANIAFGLAVVEDGNDDTALVKGILPENIVHEEKKLLELAKNMMPKLPFQELDILIIDEIGKDISGTGMDTNVVGRFMNIYVPEPELPAITRIYARGLTRNTDGNATGMGLADFISKRLYDEIDYTSTYINCLTGLVVEKARVPYVCSNDIDAINCLMQTIGLVEPEDAKMIWIKNTLELSDMYISEALARKATDSTSLSVVGELEDLEFDSSGWLISPFDNAGSTSKCNLL